MMEKMAYQAVEKEYDERVVDIARVAKVVKGGRKFHFRVTIVAGDNNGNIGLGVGKAGAVPEAMAKATLQAHKNMRKVSLSGTTIPHEVVAKVGGAEVLLKPASMGTGVIAGGGVRAVVEAAGVRDILTKSLGSSNMLNVVKATFKALEQLQSSQKIAELRGKPVKELAPFWERRKDG
ncbi:MAG: 30S ribosomal protein S5 [Anaerolineae bacterium]|jgi:small subunit ribosomal protein S5|nr:30S ribosomal protein S5 [Anaerolineae bacterium]